MTPDGIVDARREIHQMLKERYDPALEAIGAEKQEGLAKREAALNEQEELLA